MKKQPNLHTRSSISFPGAPIPWAYRKDVADGLIELRFNALANEHWASDSLEVFTSYFFEVFGSRDVSIFEIQGHLGSGACDFFSEIVREFSSRLGDRMDLEGWMELNKGVERYGMVLIRTSDPDPLWRVVKTDFFSQLLAGDSEFRAEERSHGQH